MQYFHVRHPVETLNFELVLVSVDMDNELVCALDVVVGRKLPASMLQQLHFHPIVHFLDSEQLRGHEYVILVEPDFGEAHFRRNPSRLLLQSVLFQRFHLYHRLFHILNCDVIPVLVIRDKTDLAAISLKLRLRTHFPNNPLQHESVLLPVQLDHPLANQVVAIFWPLLYLFPQILSL